MYSVVLYLLQLFFPDGVFVLGSYQGCLQREFDLLRIVNVVGFDDFDGIAL